MQGYEMEKMDVTNSNVTYSRPSDAVFHPAIDSFTGGLATDTPHIPASRY